MPFVARDVGDSVEIAPESTLTDQSTSSAWGDAQRLARLLEQQFRTDRAIVVVDLHEYSPVNTALIAVLIDAQRRARCSGAVLIVRGTTALRELAAVCRVDELLDIRSGV